jgi:hypothetical protein
MASNPISYFLYKTATLLDNTAGGIAIPGISVMGNMVDLETTVADLMRVGAISTGVLGSIGSLAQGLGNSFSGRAMLEQLGIDAGSGLMITPRGSGEGAGAQVGGGSKSASGSGYVGNAKASDIKDSVMQEADDTKKQIMVEAKEEEEANQINVLNATVLKIYELLDDVTHGSGYIKVKVEGYGLTKAGSGTAQGGVDALSSLSGTAVGGGSGMTNGVSGNGVSSGGSGGRIDFGGWTTSM